MNKYLCQSDPFKKSGMGKIGNGTVLVKLIGKASMEFQHSDPILPTLAYDMEASASAANLVYTDTSKCGISRIRKGKGFAYYLENKKISDENTLKRIRSLVIPPAWKNVWISPDEKSHVQATGLDSKNRKQYRYHTGWNQVRNHAKFATLLEFGETLPQIREKLQLDISSSKLCEEQVLALVIAVMERTYIRIGNDCYEKENGSHGLTTLKDRHVTINGHSLTFSFTGKKGIDHVITLKSRKLSRMVKQCRDLPGKELFQYISDDGIRKKVDSGMVNNYIRQVSGKQFSAKDFRTWAGSVNALRKIVELVQTDNFHPTKVVVNEIIDFVSKRLGNSRTICRKYYIHPLILEMLEKNELKEFKLNGKTANFLEPEELLLLNILKKK